MMSLLRSFEDPLLFQLQLYRSYGATITAAAFLQNTTGGMPVLRSVLEDAVEARAVGRVQVRHGEGTIRQLKRDQGVPIR